jgi:hypothetical protein
MRVMGVMVRGLKSRRSICELKQMVGPDDGQGIEFESFLVSYNHEVPPSRSVPVNVASFEYSPFNH